jgi:hypothetical protein
LSVVVMLAVMSRARGARTAEHELGSAIDHTRHEADRDQRARGQRDQRESGEVLPKHPVINRSAVVTHARVLCVSDRPHGKR